MPRAAKAQVITANALRSGRVVWLDQQDAWTRDMRAAQVFTCPNEAEAALARASGRVAEIVGCYLADVQPGPDGPEPVHFREAFRRAGPSAAARLPR